MRTINRDEFRQKLNSGRKMVWATLNDRQDFMLDLGNGMKRPIRDVTNEPNHHSRKFIGS